MAAKTQEPASEGGQCRAQSWRFVLFLCAICAIGLSGATAASCSFLKIVILDPDVDALQVPRVGTISATSTTSGLFLWDPTGEGCRTLPSDLGPTHKGARAGVAAAVGFGLAGVCIILIEYICCRFYGGRVLEVTCFLLAFAGQACTFLQFSNDLCTSDLSQPYPCRVALGTFISTGSCLLYLACSFLICCTPKPVPSCVGMRDEPRHDPCLCFSCWGKPERGGGGEEQRHRDEEQPREPAERHPREAIPREPEVEEQSLAHADAVVVGIAESPRYRQNDYRERNGLIDDVSRYWPSKDKDTTTLSLPTYRDVAFVEGDVFFDADESLHST